MTGWEGRCEICAFFGTDGAGLFTYIRDGLVKFRCKDTRACHERHALNIRAQGGISNSG